MNLPLVLHRAAQDDLDDAYAWYERQDPALGEKFLDAVRKALTHIQQSPRTPARVYRDLRHVLTRRFPYGVHSRVESRRIVVVAVYHCSRDPRGWQSRS